MARLPCKDRVTRTFKIEFPAGMPLLNSNGREHWSKRANGTSTIRMVARNLSRDIPRLEKVKIRAIYYAANNRRRDTGNLYPSFKAAIDGLVDAGVLKDDSDRYVVSLEMMRGEGIVTGGQLVIEVIDVGDSI
jgi:crossover junction endodeoxyribonuclease RusA